MVARAAAGDTDAASLAREMVGSDVPAAARPTACPASASHVLEVRGLRTSAQPGARALESVDLFVAAGQVVGIAGVDGNGQRELFEILLGLRPPVTGSVRVAGREAAPGTRPDAIAAIPPDRQLQGLAPSLSVADNLALDRRHLEAVSRGPVLSRRRLLAFARQAVSRFCIAAPSTETPVADLSGGNQQKVVVARALSGEPALLVASGPTRGLDVGAAASVHTEITAFAARGGAVLLLSTDLDEILSLSHVVFVMSGGRCKGPIDPEPAGEARAAIARVMASA